MEFRLDRFSVLKLGLFAGVAYALMSLVILVPMLLIVAAAGDSIDNSETGSFFIGGGAAIIIMPILYGIMGFIGGVISALVYNVIAKLMGGVQFTMTQVDTPRATPLGIPGAMPPANPIS
ncbi:MAG: hypothetical protein JWM86_742 [Thermoleophilia bacterium]|nr:hypothetical protein [Thermoleophilia bacterium]